MPQAHPFNGPFSGTTRVSRYQKGKTNLGVQLCETVTFNTVKCPRNGLFVKCDLKLKIDDITLHYATK